MRISWIDAERVCGGGIPVSIDNLKTLRDEGVQAIVTLTEHPLHVQKVFSQGILEDMGFTVLHVPVVDQHPPTVAQTQEVYQFIQRMVRRGKPVYLHCHAGIGRTGTMLHAFYLLQGLSLNDVREKIKTTRPASQFFMLTEVQRAFIEKLAVQLEGESPDE